MKSSLPLLLALAAFGSAAPASACDCWFQKLFDDTAPPSVPALPRGVQQQVILRDGRGLSQAGFYNDPSAFGASGSAYAPSGYAYAARPAYPHSSGGPYVIEAPPVVQRRY